MSDPQGRKTNRARPRGPHRPRRPGGWSRRRGLDHKSTLIRWLSYEKIKRGEGALKAETQAGDQMGEALASKRRKR